MGEIIKEWLNNQVELSKDFCNGYLFGELLFRFSQLADMSRFQDRYSLPTRSRRNTKETKIENFTLILPVMRNLKLKFDSNIAEKIMNGNRGVALRLLYQMKMALEKVSAPSLYKMKDEFVMSMPAQKIRPAREEYDRMTDNFFKKRLQRQIKPQKVVLMERTLQKFSLEQRRQEEIAAKEKREAQIREFESKAQKRKAELNKLQRNAGFMDEWLEKGLKEWRTNMLKKKTREKEDEKFKLKETEFHLSKIQTKKQEAKEDTYSEIRSFEKRLTQSPKLRKTKISAVASPAVGSDEEEGLGEPVSESLPVSPSAAAQKIAPVPKETKYKQAQYNKEREQRRRKMLMDQSKMQRELEAKRREDDLIEKMNRLSRQEQELEYEAWRTTQCKAVISEDRKLREARYHKREDLDTEVAMIREEEALTALRGQLDRNGEIERERAELYTVARKQAKRNHNAMECQEFFNLIFDLADEAFRQQQTVDTSEVDPRNWREWTQLFVEKLPMAANSPGTYAGRNPGTAVALQGLEAANARLDYLELLDYLRSVYQWARDGKPAEEGGDLKLINNFELGNAVRTLINMNYPPQKESDRPRLTHEVKLKLAMVGYAYGGKKTQASLLHEKHDIAVIKVDDLINEALKETEERQDDADPGEPKKEAKKEDPELARISSEIRQDILQGREVSDLHCVRLIVHKLQQLFGFVTGAEYAAQTKQALLKQPRKALPPPEKSQIVPAIPVPAEPAKPLEPEHPAEEEKKAEVVEEAKKTEHAAETVKEQKEEKKEPLPESVPAPVARPEIKEENQELTAAPAVASEDPAAVPVPPPQKVKGFILVDFPATLNQAKLLEEALSGYICPADREVETKEKLLSEAEVLAQPTPIPRPAQQLVPSGLDTVFWLKASKEECIRRAFGLKKDVKNDTTYHVLNNPPPTSNGDIVEKLQPTPESELTNAMLTDRHIAFEMASSALMKWLKMFGDVKRGRCLLQEVETPEMCKDSLGENAATQNVNSVHTLIENVVEKVLAAQNEEEKEFVNAVTGEIQHEEKEEADRLTYERNGMLFEEDLVRKLIEIEKAKEAAKAAEEEALKEKSKPKGKEDKKGASKEAAQKQAAVADAKLKHDTKVEAKPEPKPAVAAAAAAAAEPETAPPAKPVVTEVQIEDAFKPVLLEMWNASSKKYTENVMSNMRLIREQRETIKLTMNSIQKDMLVFLEKPQEKQRLVDEYIQTYNKFIDENTDMIEDAETKMEMHQRVEDLCGKLLELVEQLQKSALERREGVTKSGWAEFQLESLLVYAQSLMQAEVNRYRCFVKFAQDYYAARDGQSLQETAEDALFAQIVDGGNLPDVEDLEAGTFPRLDAIFQSAMAVLTGEAVVLNAKDQKGKKDPKRDPKKDAAAAKKKGKTEEVAAKVEENKELAALIENEKAILKYRLTMIKEFSERRLKEIRANAKQLYERLHDWIRVTIKCQREATNQLSMQLRTAIEEERKVQEELRMKSFDLVRDGKFLYFIVPPSQPLPAVEFPLDDRFTIVQLSTLVQDLRLVTNAEGLIEIGTLIALFTKKMNIGKLFGSDEGLPKSWKNFSFSTYQRIAVLMDKNATGFVSFASLASFLALLQSPLPSVKQLADYDMKLSVAAQVDCVSRADFVKTEAWFDQNEQSAQRDHADFFDRTAAIKTALFNINKMSDKEDAVNKKSVLKVLAAEGIAQNLDELASKGEKYIDLVFA